MSGSCERSGEDEEQEEEATAACGRLAGVPEAKEGPEADSDSDLETEELDLSENQLGVAGAQALCATLTVNQAMWKIQMSGLEEQVAQYLAELLLAHTDLKSLDLSYNKLNEQAGDRPNHCTQVVTVNRKLAALPLGRADRLGLRVVGEHSLIRAQIPTLPVIAASSAFPPLRHAPTEAGYHGTSRPAHVPSVLRGIPCPPSSPPPRYESECGLWFLSGSFVQASQAPFSFVSQRSSGSELPPRGFRGSQDTAAFRSRAYPYTGPAPSCWGIYGEQ
ncbi:hypothetical protein H8959_006995 [Pygathrix nigripes]